MKTYYPNQSTRSSEWWIAWVCRAEVVVGCGAMVIGGFYFRVTGNAAWILVGVTLTGLGVLHLVRDVDGLDYDRQYDTDRLYVRLEKQLSGGYTLGFDVPVDGGRVDYLLIGSPGVFAIHTCELRGRIDGRPEDETWRVTRPGTDAEEPVPNPFAEREDLMEKLGSNIAEATDTEIPVEHLVVLTYQNVEGPALDFTRFLRLGEVGEYISDKEGTGRSLTLDEQGALERRLNLSGY